VRSLQLNFHTTWLTSL